MTARTGFDDLVSARSACLRRTAYLVTGEWSRADAVVHAALARTWRDWASLERDPELHVWGEVLARSTHRAVRHREPVPDDDPLWVAYRHLAPRERALLALRHVEGLPADRVAELLDRPARSVEEQDESLIERLGTDGPRLGDRLRERTPDVDAVDLAALHARIAATGHRRGRTLAAAGVAAAVAIALLLMPSVLAGDDTTEPPPDRLAGHDVPRTLVSSGFAYEYTEGYESAALDRELTVTLASSDEPRLVAWASTTPRIGAFVTAVVDGSMRARRAAGRFEAFELLAPGSPHEVRLTQSGVGLTENLAVAVYAPTDELPPGLGDGRVVFRDRVLGERAEAAVLGARGDPEADVRVVVPDEGARVAMTCYDAEGLDVRVFLGPVEVGGRPCGTAADRDAGAGGSTWRGAQWEALLDEAGLEEGDTATLRARLHAPDGSVVDQGSAGSAVVGAALYADLVPHVRVAGVDVPTRVELGGHEWRLDGDGYVGPPGQPQVTYPVGPDDLHRLVAVVISGGAVGEPLTWDVLVGSKVVETVRSADGRTGLTLSPYLVVPQGGRLTVAVEVTQGAGPDVRVGFVPFGRVDPLG